MTRCKCPKCGRAASKKGSYWAGEMTFWLLSCGCMVWLGMIGQRTSEVGNELEAKEPST